MYQNFKICISIGQLDVKSIHTILNNAEMVEIRLDLLQLNAEDIISVFSSHSCLVATCREGLYDDVKRAELLEIAVKAGAAYIDIETDADSTWKDKMTSIARENNCKVIYSYHCFTHTPPVDELREMINSMSSEGADIIKIATKSNDQKDNSNLLSLYSGNNNLVILGMGEIGVITRIAAPFMGAPFTFASYGDKETAPGQINHKKMEKIIEMINQG